MDVAEKKPLAGPLAVVREPEGECLAVGHQQRYTIMVRNGDRMEPVDIRWTPAFDNDFVSWRPPVLTAKKQGHEQPFSATMGSQHVSWTTRTVGAPPPVADQLPPPSERPDKVRLATPQKQPVRLPVQAQFSEFKVLAIYPGRSPVNVTGQATLSVECPKGQPVALAVGDGHFTAEQPGKASAWAEFNGVRSAQAIEFEVVPESKPQSLRIEPDKLTLKPGDTTRLRALGFVGAGDQERTVGDLTERPSWSGSRTGRKWRRWKGRS